MSDDKLLHLKRKELTAIRKAARVLRDPGTTFTPASPQPESQNQTSVSPPPPPPAAAAKKPVFLYNWNSQRQRRPSSSHKSNTPSSLASAPLSQRHLPHSLSNTSSSNSSNSKKTHSYRRRTSLILRCRDTTALATPSMMRRALAPRKSNNISSSSSFRRRQQHKRNDTATSSISLDTGDHNSAASPLLPSLRRHNSCSTNSLNEASSCAYTTPALSTASYNYNPYAVSNAQSWDAIT